MREFSEKIDTDPSDENDKTHDTDIDLSPSLMNIVSDSGSISRNKFNFCSSSSQNISLCERIEKDHSDVEWNM